MRTTMITEMGNQIGRSGVHFLTLKEPYPSQAAFIFPPRTKFSFEIQSVS